MILRVGIDIGSTTVKVVVLDENDKLLFRSYERHYSRARERACETLRSIEDMLRGKDVRLVATPSPAEPVTMSWTACPPRPRRVRKVSQVRSRVLE